MEIKIVTSALGFRIELTLNGIKFETPKEFEDMKEASRFLRQHGLCQTPNIRKH